jgi:hypothetical protein
MGQGERLSSLFRQKEKKEPKRGREEEYNIYLKKEKPATGYLT